MFQSVSWNRNILLILSVVQSVSRVIATPRWPRSTDSSFIDVRYEPWWYSRTRTDVADTEANTPRSCWFAPLKANLIVFCLGLGLQCCSDGFLPLAPELQLPSPLYQTRICISPTRCSEFLVLMGLPFLLEWQFCGCFHWNFGICQFLLLAPVGHKSTAL